MEIITNPNQRRPLALGSLNTHNNKEKHHTKCRHYRSIEEISLQSCKAHENLDPP